MVSNSHHLGTQIAALVKDTMQDLKIDSASTASNISEQVSTQIAGAIDVAVSTIKKDMILDASALALREQILCKFLGFDVLFLFYGIADIVISTH